MKTLNIEIKSRVQADTEFIASFKAAQEGKKGIAPQRGVYFTSLEAVRSLLSDKRMALLHIIRTRHPKSIYELAKISGRNFKNVHSDVTLLKKYGLIHISNQVRRYKRPLASLNVPYQSINIHAVV